MIPVGKSTWWAGVKSGRYPQAYKLGPRTTAWKAADILKLIAEIEAGNHVWISEIVPLFFIFKIHHKP